MKGVKKEALKEVITWSFSDSDVFREAFGTSAPLSIYEREKIVNFVKRADRYSIEGKLVLSSKDLSFELLEDSRVVSPRSEGFQDLRISYSCNQFIPGQYIGDSKLLNIVEKPHRLFFSSCLHHIRPLPGKSI